MLPDLLMSRRRGGHIDAVEETVVVGWAVDLTQTVAPAALLLLVDDQILGSFSCSEPRPDLNALNVPGTRLGFRVELPPAALDGKPHRLRIRFRSGEVLTHGTDRRDEVAVLYRSTIVQGRVDGIFGLSIRGWAFRLDKHSATRTGRVTIEIRANGAALARTVAGLPRPDVADVHRCDLNCGFLYTLPPALRDGQEFALEFHAVPEDMPLAGSPFRGHALGLDNADRLVALYARAETLCTQLYALKDELRQLVAVDEYTVATYHAWAVAYAEALRARVAAVRRTPDYEALLGGPRPTVSIICPVYRPALADFAAAVESVRRQSWTEWELILVDDGSRSPALAEVIAEFCAADPRIRALPQKKNQGISAATNAGVAAATGDWIALLDHDDLLVDVALEVMLLAAANTGAQCLYSDEDKIDPLGYFSEPHFKTDWNYRLLLTNNYVCHFLMVQASVLHAVGPMQSRYDGAQDHDLVLRLAEHLPAAAIHHVPEVLYHWRKAAGSTARAASAKPYAVNAGKQAVADHLARRDLSATVTAAPGATLYDVRWTFRAEPTVAILVPFRDQLATTRECVERILATTRYGAYQLVLIDNWSVETETRAWLAKMDADESRVRVIHREENFNFSRLNNQVAEQLEVDFLLFLNNDVFIQQADWLRRMVDEALADPHVGAVGVKLLYPDDTVQHAGVVLGVMGGIANHSFRLAAQDDNGYANRAACSQDVSAVTAACMLCRADAFRAVGMFDEASLPIAFNDVDLCLRLGRAGYRIVLTTAVVAEHRESVSRGSDFAAHHLSRFYGENQAMQDRWAELIRFDPFYNPHFSRETGMFDTLSSASLRLDRAPSLLRKPVPRATLPPGSRYPEPPADREPAPRPGGARRNRSAKTRSGAERERVSGD